MKANKEPERIWIDPINDLPKLSGHIDKDSIEYIRTDAFIEKACDYIKEHLFDYRSQSVTDESKFIEDFRKALEKGDKE